MTYPGTRAHGKSPRSAKATVTTGFRCAPESAPSERITAITVRPGAVTSAARPIWPWLSSSTTTAPAALKTSRNVPRDSARSRCGCRTRSGPASVRSPFAMRGSYPVHGLHQRAAAKNGADAATGIRDRRAISMPAATSGAVLGCLRGVDAAEHRGNVHDPTTRLQLRRDEQRCGGVRGRDLDHRRRRAGSRTGRNVVVARVEGGGSSRRQLHMAGRRRQVPLHGRGDRASGATVELDVRVAIQIAWRRRNVREHPGSMDRACGPVDTVRPDTELVPKAARGSGGRLERRRDRWEGGERDDRGHGDADQGRADLIHRWILLRSDRPAQAPALGSNGPTSSVDGSVGPLQGGTKLASALDGSRVPAPFPRSILQDTGPDSCGQAFDHRTRTEAADPGCRLTTGHPCGWGAAFAFHCGSLALTWTRTSFPCASEIDTAGRPVRVQVAPPTFVRSIDPSTDPIAPSRETLPCRSDAAHPVNGGATEPECTGIVPPEPWSSPRLATPAEAPATINTAPSTDATAFSATLRRARPSIVGGTPWTYGTSAARSRSTWSSWFRSSSITIAPHVDPQLGEASRHEGSHRSRPASQDVGHPLLGEAFVDAEHDGRPLPDGQPLEPLPQLVTAPAA